MARDFGKTLVFLALLAWGGAAWSLAAEGPASQEIVKPVNLWPLFLRRAEGGRVDLEVLFSLISYQREGGKLDLAVRPFYWRSVDPGQERARTDVLWPLAMRERERGAISTRVLPLFFQKYEPPEFSSLLFPLYHYKSEERRRELGVLGYIPFTLFMFERDFERDLVHQRYLFWTYDRLGEETTIAAAPLYSQRTAPGRGSITLSPLFADAWRTPTGFHRLSSLGLADTFNLYEYRRDPPHQELSWHALNLWRLQRGRDWRTVFFPIYWHSFIQGDRTLFWWPLYGRRESGTSVEYSTLWPFFSRRNDPAARETDFNFLWPLARDHRRGPARDERFLPFFFSSVDPGQTRKPSLLPLALALPAPLSYRAAGKDFSYRRIFYFAWLTETPDWTRNVALNNYYFRDKRTGAVHQGVFPLYHGSRWGQNKLDLLPPLFGSYRGPDFSFRTFLPLYWSYASTTTAATVLFPTYFGYRSGPRALRAFFPLYYHARDDLRQTELDYYFPFYGTYRRGENLARHFLFFPLYSRLKDEASGLVSLDLAWPLFHVERSSAAASTRLLPLFWRSRAPGRSFSVAFPLYWDWDGPESRHRYLFPLYGAYERRGLLSLSVFGPFYWKVERPQENYRRSDFLASLYSRSRAGSEYRSHLFPFYWRWTSPEQDSRYFPPLGGYESLRSGYRSLFFLGLNRSLNLFSFERAPRYGERADRILLYYSRSDRASSFTTLFPLYWDWNDPEERVRALFPLGAWEGNPLEGGWDLSLLGLPDGLSLFEFSGNRRREQASQRLLFFYHDRRQGDRRTVLFPFFWQRLSPAYSRSQLFPLYAYRRDGGEGEKEFGMLGATPRWSLCAWSDSPLERTSWLWPLYGYGRDKKEGERYLSLLGPCHQASLFLAEKGKSGVRGRLFPLYSYERRGTPGSSGFYRETKVLGRLYSLEERGADSADLRLLYRLVRSSRAPGESAFELNPFYFKISKGRSSYWAILGGLFGMETHPDGSRSPTILWIF